MKSNEIMRGVFQDSADQMPNKRNEAIVEIV